ncbi:5-(carboxyamino)imidazole ribonucleotide mutase [Wolbachia endosymbiont of Ctenocephalides felis wCfeJ]|uniref:5-(carboxyamino)imidazole ribonucleotide mutase n=1 Tax=Wolbachia endosymbiont of Ctenocephalides felis wCfeJ TaxID=2732594 RepID=UPI001445EDC8|nr:5-(carboxyamino)imidazole ribonucleotide mutase [Wolbachia endosymbiont of Ctenocephalides felis wCfeJ]WCR57771.1 MAG: N5-carboxyaminoimidazole ribonucleotide mutase [Wolbachia endosymbiont of Ctenocephalides felis wCfeJ]
MFNVVEMKKDVAVIMGSQSDYSTMSHAVDMLKELGISHDIFIISAHRTPDRLFNFAKSAQEKGFKIIIAGAGGAAHLPGMVASLTYLPVIGIPVRSKELNGLDSLLSIVQMPKGVPVATMSIGEGGACNAAIAAASILSISNSEIAGRLKKWRDKQTEAVKEKPTS